MRSIGFRSLPYRSRDGGSTLCLYAMFALTHAGRRAGASDLLRQLAAAALIAGAVLISMLPAKRSAAT